MREGGRLVVVAVATIGRAELRAALGGSVFRGKRGARKIA